MLGLRCECHERQIVEFIEEQQKKEGTTKENIRIRL
jgi:hypothetical protein